MNRLVWVLLALFMLSFVGATSPPTISEQPKSETVLLGTAIQLTVVAAGEDLHYQWQKDGKDIDGAVAAVHVVPTAALSDSGDYQVRVTNDKGAVASCIAKIAVVENGVPSKSPPTCPAPSPSGDSGGGCGGGGGGGGSSTSSSSSSSSGAPDPGTPPEFDGDMFKPYPVTRWKGSVKVTRVMKQADADLTSVLEGEVTFESGANDIGLHPTTLTAVEGSLTYRREGTGGGCTDTVNASGTIKPGEGAINFQPDPPLPERTTQLKYQGGGNSRLEGTQVRSCPSSGGTTSNAWLSHEDGWLLTGEQVTSPDLLVISGTYVHEYPPMGTTLTYEWHLVKQR